MTTDLSWGSAIALDQTLSMHLKTYLVTPLAQDIQKTTSCWVVDVCAALQARWPQLGIVDQQLGDVVDSLAISQVTRLLGMFRGCWSLGCRFLHFMAASNREAVGCSKFANNVELCHEEGRYTHR